MILAEALTVRKEQRTRLDDLKTRLLQSALVQEGEPPPEDPEMLLLELDQQLDFYAQLVARIHLTNLSARLPDGRSITEAVAARDALDERVATLRSLADQAGKVNERYVRSELRYIPTVSVAKLRQDVDRSAQERRKLDVAIQATNWRVELLEE